METSMTSSTVSNTCPICQGPIVRTGITIECDSPSGRGRITREVVHCSNEPIITDGPPLISSPGCWWIAAVDVSP